MREPLLSAKAIWEWRARFIALGLLHPENDNLWSFGGAPWERGVVSRTWATGRPERRVE